MRLPFYFKLRKLGPLVGTRTWGGLVGTLGAPPTIDGGGITAPTLAFYNLEGKWDVENIGVTPGCRGREHADRLQPTGKTPQLERAVAEAMKLLEKNPLKRLPRPGLDRPRIETIRRMTVRIKQRLSVVKLLGDRTGGIRHRHLVRRLVLLSHAKRATPVYSITDAMVADA